MAVDRQLGGGLGSIAVVHCQKPLPKALHRRKENLRVGALEEGELVVGVGAGDVPRVLGVGAGDLAGAERGAIGRAADAVGGEAGRLDAVVVTNEGVLDVDGGEARGSVAGGGGGANEGGGGNEELHFDGWEWWVVGCWLVVLLKRLDCW